jgi:hypothetical protein
MVLRIEGRRRHTILRALLSRATKNEAEAFGLPEQKALKQISAVLYSQVAKMSYAIQRLSLFEGEIISGLDERLDELLDELERTK